MNNLVKTLFILVVLGGIGFGVYRSFFEAHQGKPLFFHDKSLRLVSGGETTTDATKGQVTVVACFQTWCSDCIKEIPLLAEMRQMVGSDRINVLLISDEPFDKLVRFAGAYGDDIQIAQATFGFKASGIDVYPTTFLLNKDGEIVLEKFEGWNWTNPETLELIRDEINR